MGLATWGLELTADRRLVWRRTVNGQTEERAATPEDIADAMDDLYELLGREEFEKALKEKKR